MANYQLAMVSEWMVNGNINEFVKAHGEVDRFKLLKDVVKGLIYMHDRVMIHGDLKGANILIDQDGHARLADFGLLTIISDSSNPMTSGSSVKGGTIRWMSPELLDPGRFGFEHDRPTKGSDCYALGMVILEVLSGKTPFTPLKDLIVMQKVIEGERPARPEGAEGEWFTDDLWQMLNLCWATRLGNRPNIGVVLECLERASRSSTGTGNDAENNANDEPSSAANDSSGQIIARGGEKYPFPSQDCLGSVTGPVMTHGGEADIAPPPQLPASALRHHINGKPPGYVQPALTVVSGGEDPLGCVGDSKRQKITRQSPTTGSNRWPPSDANSKDGGQPHIRARTPPLLVTYKSRIPARTSETVTAPHNSTRGEAPTQEFANSNLTPKTSRQQAALFLNSKDLLRNVRGLTPEDQTKFLDKVDQAYSTVGSQNARLITALGNLCSAIERLPTSAVLSTLEKRGNIAVASGGFTDIWRGDFGGAPVAIKAFRIYPAQDLKEAKEILWKRVPTWMKLSHENILPFRGVNMALVQLALVYDWGRNGNISQYLASHPSAPRPSLLLDVAKGLEYLHSLDIPHGDLKGANVIIDQGGRARLTEYGLAPINSDPSFTVAATPGAVGGSRWLAPEIIILPRRGSGMSVMEPKAADVFAFGMLAVEVFTGKIPFEEQKNEAVVLCISQGGRPEMPPNARAVGLTGEMWKLLESCWQQIPKKRPTMEEVVRKWQKFVESINDNNNVVPEEQGGGPSRRRVKTEAPRPSTKAKAARLRTMSEVVQPRTKSEAVRPRSTFEAVQSPRSEVIQQRPKLEDIQPIPSVFDSPPTPTHKRCLYGLF